MLEDTLKSRDFSNEFVFQASRSSGAGGQNVNKVSTKVELRFKVQESNLLSDEEKMLIMSKLTARINNEGIFHIVSQTERTQLQNKEKCIEKFYTLVAKALTPKKKRKPTRIPASVNEHRLENKRITSERKELRKKL